MRFLLVGLIVPHAPVLLPQVRGGEPPPAAAPDDSTPLCVLLSPHGRATGVYRRVRGDLAGFGLQDTATERKTDRVFGKELARRWGEPLLDEDIDHGAVVPLNVAVPPGLATVAATLREITGPGAAPVEEAIAAGRRFADAVRELGDDNNLIVAASAHTSAALSAAAPLTERPAGHELERRVTRALEDDLGLLAEIEPELWIESGACGAGTLTAFGALFAGTTARVTFREAPFGVGYLLAQTA